jgi:cell division protein FtsX
MAATHSTSTHKSHSHETENALTTDERKQMSDSTYAFPKQRKEPLNDASHVRNAIARFDQVKDVSDEDREEAFRNIQAAAKKFGVEMKETSWRELGAKPHTESASQRKAS